VILLSEPVEDCFVFELSALYHPLVVEHFKECYTLFTLVPGFLGFLVWPVVLPVQRSFVCCGIHCLRGKGEGSLVVVVVG